MHGGGSCSPCWMPAPLRHQKPRRRLLRTGHCSASGPTRSPQGEELTSKSPCQTVGSTALHVVKTLFQGTRGQSINLQLSESWCRFYTTSYYLWQIINNCWRSSPGCTKLILTTASEQVAFTVNVLLVCWGRESSASSFSWDRKTQNWFHSKL